jgi:hypothetical protein
MQPMPMQTAEQLLKEKQAMRDAVAAYAGPVTKCPPGKARGWPVKPRNKTAKPPTWGAARRLSRHAGDGARPVEEQKADGRRLRTEQRRLRQQREDKRDAPQVRRANRQKRIAELSRDGACAIPRTDDGHAH